VETVESKQTQFVYLVPGKFRLGGNGGNGMARAGEKVLFLAYTTP
jgi:hypothetical protein